MLNSRSHSALLAPLALLVLMGCGDGAAPAGETATAAPADVPTATPAALPRVRMVITADEGDFRTEGAVEQGHLLTVADESGNGLGFRPTAIEPYDDSTSLVSIDVVLLENIGTGEETTEERLVGLKILEGSSGTVDPGDGEGTFTVAVEAVERP